jgi:tetratricopeptide (TPR) repeat protein
VAELGGDRAAAEISGVSKSIWYDAKRGRSVPNQTITWPAMRAVLAGVPASVTGVRNWDELYEAVLAESRIPRRPTVALTRSPTGPPPRQLPPTSGPFVAREAEFAELTRRLLRPAQQAVPIVVLAGLPGVGKTALALHWAWQLANRFPDGVLYADLRGWAPDRPLDPQEVLPDWLRALGLEPAAMADQLAGYTAMLRTALQGQRLLIVLDNARDEEQVRPLLPGSPSCPVLVTSRQRLSGLAIHHGADSLQVKPLAERDSIGLLREVLGKRVDRELAEAAVLAGLCGGLPLALRIVAETAKAWPGAQLASFVAELADAAHRLSLLGINDPRSDPRTVISWSYQQLPVEIATTFRALGWFPGQELHSYAAAALAGVPPSTVMPHLRALARLHLLQETAVDRIELHDLIRLYAAELAQRHDGVERGAAARRRLFDYYLDTASRADELVEPLRHRLSLPGSEVAPTALRDQAQALAWLDAERANVVTLCAQDHPELDTARWQLAYLMRGYFFRTKRLHEWLRSHERALAAAIRSGDRHAEAMTRGNLGVALHESGDDDSAMGHYRTAWRLFREVGDQYGVASTMAHQAAVLRRRGDFTGSIRLNRRALAFYRKTGSARHIAITLRGIGLAELELGRLDDAERHLEESLDLCVALNLQMDTARASNTLGRLHSMAGRHDAAVGFFRRAIAADQASGGRYESALALRGLGAVAAATGDLERAADHLRDALQVLESLGSPKAPEVRDELLALHRNGAV